MLIEIRRNSAVCRFIVKYQPRNAGVILCLIEKKKTYMRANLFDWKDDTITILRPNSNYTNKGLVVLAANHLSTIRKHGKWQYQRKWIWWGLRNISKALSFR